MKRKRYGCKTNFYRNVHTKDGLRMEFIASLIKQNDARRSAYIISIV